MVITVSNALQICIASSAMPPMFVRVVASRVVMAQFTIRFMILLSPQLQELTMIRSIQNVLRDQSAHMVMVISLFLTGLMNQKLKVSA